MTVKRIAIASIVCFTSACSTKTKLPDDQLHSYVCKTSTENADGYVLRQQFSVHLNREEMIIRLKQSRPGDALLEKYPYTKISEGIVEGRNSAGLRAYFAIKRAALEMKMTDAGPKIIGKCVLAE